MAASSAGRRGSGGDGGMVRDPRARTMPPSRAKLSEPGRGTANAHPVCNEEQAHKPTNATEDLMWSMTRILVPTDFSELAAAATEAAIELAQKFSVPIVLMHAYEIPV